MLRLNAFLFQLHHTLPNLGNHQTIPYVLLRCNSPQKPNSIPSHIAVSAPFAGLGNHGVVPLSNEKLNRVEYFASTITFRDLNYGLELLEILVKTHIVRIEASSKNDIHRHEIDEKQICSNTYLYFLFCWIHLYRG
jgi:hypothetical protein